LKAKIFVSAGTHSKGFKRLIHKIDKIAEKKEFNFFAQTGNTEFKPKNIEFKKFISPKEMNKKIEWSDLLIVHGGAGTIGPAIQKQKKIIVVPRLKEFKEHTDNHQLELGLALKEKYGFECITELNELEKKINETLKKNNFNFKKENSMELIIKKFIQKNFEGKK
jgi:UDP-N-acetylglucosamine transferase subunit ALG13